MAPKYPPERRQEAIDLLNAGIGTNEIARRLKVNPSTVSRWGKTAGVAPRDRAAHTQAAHEATRLAWAQRRAELVDQFGDVVVALLDRLTDAPPADVRHLVWSLAVLTDKAELLSGRATSRTEVFDAERRRQRVLSLTDELADRRATKTAGTAAGSTADTG